VFAGGAGLSIPQLESFARLRSVALVSAECRAQGVLAVMSHVRTRSLTTAAVWTAVAPAGCHHRLGDRCAPSCIVRSNCEVDSILTCDDFEANKPPAEIEPRVEIQRALRNNRRISCAATRYHLARDQFFCGPIQNMSDFGVHSITFMRTVLDASAISGPCRG